MRKSDCKVTKKNCNAVLFWSKSLFVWLWHGVVAAAAPRIAAQNAFYGKPRAFRRAMFSDGFDGVLRAGGRVATGRWKVRRNGQLVKSDGQNQYAFQQFFHSTAVVRRSMAATICRSTVRKSGRVSPTAKKAMCMVCGVLLNASKSGCLCRR